MKNDIRFFETSSSIDPKLHWLDVFIEGEYILTICSKYVHVFLYSLTPDLKTYLENPHIYPEVFP
jgi:hypothetical protein